jgi:hypothetical protein
MGFGLVNLGFQESLFSGTNADFGQDSHPCLLQLLGPREEQLLRLFNVFERLFIVRIEKWGVHANLINQRTVCCFTSRGKVKQTMRSSCCYGAGSPPIMVREFPDEQIQFFCQCVHGFQALCSEPVSLL